ncbi:hypothetical protein [Candidatus Venteria ishoeyi]|uniref:Uncharacterized protein n=1 Tax=Candidatus Venteria ishoeyi TaxID=1899563 RepID=A0A1H6F5G2_9GAMM|nr:hypothetical protein [Candidatus Venteria ishoeyi]SEH04519.1 Uncharacterised protein [Candidatus Venteria ishoeyi]
MNDTKPEMAAKVQALYMQRSGEERMMMCLEMFDFARQLMIANLKAQGYEGMELRKQVLIRTYRNDFSPETLNKMCQRIAKS